MEKKVSAGEASTSEVLDEIKECVHRKQDFLVQRSRTAALWIQYLEMVDILRSFIRAERTPRGTDQNAAISRCVRPQLVREVCSTILTVDERSPNGPPGCLPSLHFGSSRSKKKWSILGWIIDRPSHRTGPYEKSEDRWRLDQREGPNGIATSHLAVINACVCRNKPHHARADGSSVQLWRTEQRYV